MISWTRYTLHELNFPLMAENASALPRVAVVEEGVSGFYAISDEFSSKLYSVPGSNAARTILKGSILAFFLWTELS